MRTNPLIWPKMLSQSVWVSRTTHRLSSAIWLMCSSEPENWVLFTLTFISSVWLKEPPNHSFLINLLAIGFNEIRVGNSEIKSHLRHPRVDRINQLFQDQMQVLNTMRHPAGPFELRFWSFTGLDLKTCKSYNLDDSNEIYRERNL